VQRALRRARGDGERQRQLRGHTIIIEADEERAGRWRWSYLIDGRIATVARVGLPDG
jgi:hypothetical protein